MMTVDAEQALLDSVASTCSAVSNLTSLMGAYPFETAEGKRKIWSEMLNQLDKAKNIKKVDALVDQLLDSRV